MRGWVVQRFVTMVACAAVLGLLTPERLAAQVGVTTDIITGVVVNEAGQPVAEAMVDALSLETQITRSARTDARGRYTIIFPDGGGQYRVTARAIGLTPQQAIVQRYSDEDRLVWNVRLSASAVALEDINVTAGRSAVRIPERPTPGNTERIMTTDQTARLPIDAADINLLATLVPGVIGIGATDSTAAAFSVAGQRADANAITLDGLLFGSGAIPTEGVRNTRVITSTYDVSRGQFSGGLIASTTRSGSNVVTGASGYTLRDDALAVESGEESSPYNSAFTQHQLSGGLGGPLARDRFFAYGSAQVNLRRDPQPNLLSATASDLLRQGIHPDSVGRFLDLVATTGVNPYSVPAIDTRTNDNLSAMLRFDYLLSNAHTLTIRGDWRGTDSDPSRVGALALPQTGGTIGTSGGGAMVSLTSRFGVSLLNEGRIYLSGNTRDTEVFTRLPGGRVQVSSALPDNSVGVTTLSFGGGQAVQTSSGTTLDISNELSWIPGSGAHRVKIGGLWRSQKTSDIQTGNAYGTFSYNSLVDFQANRPSSFRRTLNPTERRVTANDWAGYIGDVWYASRPLQLTYGVRVEGSWFAGAPDYNPAIDSLFGVRTDRLPSEVHLSPRVGFTWTIGTQNAATRGGGFGMGGPTTWILRGGVGEFRSPIPTTLVSLVQSAPGLEGTQAQINCIGAGVPTPDWDAYQADAAAIPTSCLGGPVAAAPPRTVAVFADDYTAPRSWRGSLGLQRNLTQMLRLTFDVSYARGVSQYGTVDLNLNATPRFSLANEGNRPVFVGTDDIATATGAVRLDGSRIDRRFGQVNQTVSSLSSDTWQGTISLGGMTRRGIMIQGSYTWQRSRDQLSSARGFGGFGGGGTTAGNPNVFEWSRSDFERPHSFLATVTKPFGASMELTGIGRLMSGTPFTPMVGSDINGDGSRNDRAFVFAPGGTSEVAAAMDRLLAGSSDRVQSCLTTQVGQAAARNSCVGPWQATLDLQLNWRPSFWGLNRRLAVSMTTVNLLRGIDELVHGASDARGWGLTLRPDPTLLYVTGFDPVNRQYQYTVNERFGATGSGANALRSPFQIGIQLRYTIGPDRMRQAIDAMRGGGMGGPGGPGGRAAGPLGLMSAAGNPADMVARLNAMLPNPAAAALELKDSLQLDDRQVNRLEAIRDTLAESNRVLAEAINKELTAAGGTPDLQRMAGVLGPRLQEARANLSRALTAVQQVLTPFQWGRLPESIRNPQMARPGMGPGRPDGPGRRPPV